MKINKFSKKMMLLLITTIFVSNVSYAFETGVDESKKYEKMNFNDRVMYVNKKLNIKKDFLLDISLKSSDGEIRVNDSTVVSEYSRNRFKRKYVVRDRYLKDIVSKEKSIKSIAKGSSLVLNKPITIEDKIEVTGKVDDNTLQIAKEVLKSNFGDGISKKYEIETKFVGPDESSSNNSRMYYYSIIFRTGYLRIKKVGENDEYSEKIYYKVPIRIIEWTKDRFIK